MPFGAAHTYMTYKRECYPERNAKRDRVNAFTKVIIKP